MSWVLLLIIYGNSSVEVMTTTSVGTYATEYACSVAGAAAANAVHKRADFNSTYLCVQRPN